MTYPDTLEQAAGRLLQRIERGCVSLGAPPTHFEEDDEHRTFRLAAVDGALAYAALLAEQIEQGQVTELGLEMAELVATTAERAGWVSATGAVTGRGEARERLEREGFLAFYPPVPGQWVACYRLVAPC